MCDHDQKMQYVGNDDCWSQRGSRGGIEWDQVACGDMQMLLNKIKTKKTNIGTKKIENEQSAN